ncbi:YraN family protein [Hyphomonas sp.]|uniref:YraN family protein n=1 Tax=Hyphomonas sp. TaxID=87 RepID=UPI00391CEF6B
MRKAERRAAEIRGRMAERRAALWLRLKGYSILAARVKLPVGEIDLVARKGKLIAFIEVKARTRQEDALGAVTQQSWQRISRAAEAWMSARPRYADHGWRYDLIALAPGRMPRHIRDAWRPGLA